MAKWEYLVVFIEGSKLAQDKPEIDVYLDVDKYTESLNKYGEAGWELVSFENHMDGARASFKRVKIVQPQAQPEKTKRSSKKKVEVLAKE